MSMSPSQPQVEVFILSYNRPEYILQTIDSVIKQTYPNLKVIVSDNSSQNDVEAKIRTYVDRSKITYIKRKPSLAALAHFNTVFSEATADYFMIFHDDDVMLPEAVSKLMNTITKDPNLAAVGGNAFILEENSFTRNVFDPNLQAGKKISDPDEIALHYLDSRKGHVPFPSYIYRRAKVNGLKMIFKEGQKHSDVSFLIKASKQGPLFWVEDQVMYYRRHGKNDSINLDVPALFSLCRFLLKNTKVSPSIIEQYKMKSYLLWMKQRRSGVSKSLSPWRDRVIMKHATIYCLRHPSIFVKLVLKRLIQR